MSSIGEHVFLSYQWDSKDIVYRIRDSLRDSGYRVWIDVENMNESVTDGMAEAVQNAAVVILCMSVKYKDSFNCRKEAEFAFRLRKPIVPIRLERKYIPDGWLGLIIGSLLVTDFSDEKNFDEKFSYLLRLINGRGLCESEEDGSLIKTKKSPVAAVRPYVAENNVVCAQVKILQPIKASEPSEACEDAVKTKLKSLDIAAIKPFAVEIEKKCDDEVEYKAEKLVDNQMKQINIDIPNACPKLRLLTRVDKSVGHGVTRLQNMLYVLSSSTLFRYSSIHVYQADSPFVHLRDLKTKDIGKPNDIAACHINNCLYITDEGNSKCVWRVTLPDDRVTRWLSGIDWPLTLSVSRTDGTVHILRQSRPSVLESYNSDGTRTNAVCLPLNIDKPQQAIETTSGEFVVSYGWKDSQVLSHGICLLAKDGSVVRQFYPRDGVRQMNCPLHLTIDEDGRVYVVDNLKNRVVLFDQQLNWVEEILMENNFGIRKPERICYVREKKQLVLVHEGGKKLDIYELNA